MVILIAEDEVQVRNTLGGFFTEPHEVILCKSGNEALEALKKTAVDVVITDHQMPGISGLELIKNAKKQYPSTAFVLMTAFGSVDHAIEAIRAGADDYFMKPFDLEDVGLRIQRLEDLRSWKAEHELKEDADVAGNRLIGKSAAIKSAQTFIQKVAGVPSPVLLLGPSGSGKEVVAKAIHESGSRSRRPFIPINCASINEQLMESELFGHEKGAFTGATGAKPGKFELAKGGTIFLDEVGELSLSIQAKLLRVLQEKEFFRLGGVQQVKTDARVLAATHRSLTDMVRKGTFREDLYFRLNVLTFKLSPLSERQEDIPLLIDYLWSRLARELGRRVTIAPETMAYLCSYSYPGNVRELQNALERLMVLGGEMEAITPDLLPPEFCSRVRQEPGSLAAVPEIAEKAEAYDKGLTAVMEAYESRVVLDAMERAKHNQLRAAELLKINRGALQYKLKKYGYQSSRVSVAADDSEKAA